jgi:hypothetical protein
VLFGIGWLGTAIAWAMTRRAPGAAGSRRKPDASETTLSSSPGLQALQQACLHGDRHAAQEALLAWGREIWPDQPVTSLGALAGLAPPDLAREIQALDHSLYGSGGASWDCAALWGAMSRFHRPTHPGSALESEALTPLNPKA